MNRVQISRLVVTIALTGTCLGTSTGLAVTARAAAAACSAEIPEVGSLDADSSPDLAVGLPITGEISHVEVRYTSLPTARIADPYFSSDTFTTFGDALTSIDVNHDGCSELIVSSGFGEKVSILKGSPTGVSTTGMQTIDVPAGDARFGSVLASARGTGDTVDLWVGAPDSTVNGVSSAGAVEHYVLTAAGVVTHAARLTAASLGGTPIAGSHFGAALSARAGGVAIGVPDDRVSGAVEAGSVWVATLSPTGAVTGKHWSQATAGVPGTPEAHDNFGTSVVWGGSTLAVGAPREDVGSAKNTGSVTVIPPTGAITSITQNSPGVPGNNESGDWFGDTLTAGAWLTCQEEIEFAVGSPYEDVGTVKNAGMVTILPTKDCKGVGLTQGKHGGLGGKPETRDHVGIALSILRGRDDFDEDVQDSLVIGVPGEDIGTKIEAGLAYVRRATRLTSYPGSTGNREFGAHLTIPGAGQMFSN